MNNKEREYLERVYKCLKIPQFATGTQSTTMHGLASYAKDCAFALPKIQDVLYLIGSGMEVDHGEVESCLTEIEDWFNERKTEDWK